MMLGSRKFLRVLLQQKNKLEVGLALSVETGLFFK